MKFQRVHAHTEAARRLANLPFLELLSSGLAVMRTVDIEVMSFV